MVGRSVGTYLLAVCAFIGGVSASPASSSLSSLPLAARAQAATADGSDIFQSCVRRYNTSRMNPLPQAGYANPNNATNGSMLTVRSSASHMSSCAMQPNPPPSHQQLHLTDFFSFICACADLVGWDTG